MTEPITAFKTEGTDMLLTDTTSSPPKPVLCALLILALANGFAQEFTGQHDALGNLARWQGLPPFEPTETLTLPLPDASPKPVRSFGHLSLSFERNEGQADAEAKFLACGSGYHLFLT